jgi:spermidine/putrescine transport system permease protein
MKKNNLFEGFSLGLIMLWLFLFAVLPFLFVLWASFLENQAPFSFHNLTIVNYVQLIDPIYLRVFEKSLLLASVATLACLIIGYPFAYLLAKIKSRYKNLLLMLVIIPFWTSSLIRSYAMVAVLKTKGLINTVLLKFGLIEQPLHLLFTNTAVLVGLIYNLLPFMIIPLYANLERFDRRLLEAGQDLGASRRILFQNIILPLSMPGIISGSIMVFLPAMTLFYISDILGGAKSLLLGNLMRNTILETQNWPLGAAISIALLLIMAIMLFAYASSTRRSEKQELL